PGKTVQLPVVFFVDPDMAKDWQADDVRGITLSYTYFRATGPQASARLEDASAVN
nr:cytochrome c oxidase assembly protein [Hyphomonadaceae bacterium]